MDVWHYLSLSIAARLAFPSYPAEGKTRETPCRAIHIPPITTPKQWNRGKGTQMRVSVCGTKTADKWVKTVDCSGGISC